MYTNELHFSTIVHNVPFTRKVECIQISYISAQLFTMYNRNRMYTLKHHCSQCLPHSPKRRKATKAEQQHRCSHQIHIVTKDSIKWIECKWIHIVTFEKCAELLFPKAYMKQKVWLLWTAKMFTPDAHIHIVTYSTKITLTGMK